MYRARDYSEVISFRFNKICSQLNVYNPAIYNLIFTSLGVSTTKYNSQFIAQYDGTERLPT